MIRDDIKAATIAAMKGGDKETTGTLRLVQAASEGSPRQLGGERVEGGALRRGRGLRVEGARGRLRLGLRLCLRLGVDRDGEVHLVPEQPGQPAGDQASKRLEGWMSRWIRPRSWMCCRPSAACRT